MSMIEKRYQVFVSSTFADLKDERNSVIRALIEMDCIPSVMEAFTAVDDEQLEFIKKVIDDCDYYVLIIGGRYGSVDDHGVSYTQREYQYALEKKIPVLAFLHNDVETLPVSKSDASNPNLYQKLSEFRNLVMRNRIVKMWSDPKELAGLVVLSLSRAMKMAPGIGWVRGNAVASRELLMESRELAEENAALKKTVSSLESQLAPQVERLAALEISVTVKLAFYDERTPRGPRQRETHSVGTSFEEVFSLIGPHLIKPTTDKEVKALIAEVLANRYKLSTHRAASYSTDDETFQTIKIQLETHGLITIQYAKTAAGSYGVFWSLTQKGRSVVTELRGLRSAN